MSDDVYMQNVNWVHISSSNGKLAKSNWFIVNSNIKLQRNLSNKMNRYKALHPFDLQNVDNSDIRLSLRGK